MDMLQQMNTFGRMQKVVHHKVKYQGVKNHFGDW